MEQQEDIKRAIAEAAKIAAEVPEPLREAAFNAAYASLIGENTGASGTGAKSRPRSKRAQRVDDDPGPDPVKLFNDQVDRTKYPDVEKSTSLLDRSLWVLRVARVECGIDGLLAGQIERILVDKFRLTASRRGVAKALDQAGRFVNVTKTSQGTTYRIMQPGETHLEKAEHDEPPADKNAAAPPRRRRKRDVAATGKPRSGKPKARRAGPGPTDAVKQLIESGYFDEPRTIGDMRSYLAAKRGLRLEVTDLSPILVRLLRNGALDRDKAENGQYEYRST